MRQVLRLIVGTRSHFFSFFFSFFFFFFFFVCAVFLFCPFLSSPLSGPSRDAAKSLLIEIRQHSQAIQQRAALAAMHAHATPKTNAAKTPAHAQQQPQQQAQPHQSPALADQSSASFFSHGGTPARGTATPAAAGGGAQSALSSPSGGSFFSTPMRSP